MTAARCDSEVHGSRSSASFLAIHTTTRSSRRSRRHTSSKSGEKYRMVESKQKQIAVVGAAAYVGGPLLRLLKAEGYRVVALVRESTDASSLGDLPDVVVRGDLSDFRL